MTGTFRLGGDLEVWRLGFGAMGIADGAAEQAYAVLRRAVVPGVDSIDRSPVVLPFPGTSSLARLQENMAAAAT